MQPLKTDETDNITSNFLGVVFDKLYLGGLWILKTHHLIDEMVENITIKLTET